MDSDPPILVSCPINGDLEIVFEQISAYNQILGNCIHVIHIGREAVRNGLIAQMEDSPFDIRKFDNVVINDTHLFSRRPSILGLHVMNLEFALRQRIPFGHVYLHTASDLPYRHGLGTHIRAHDLGLGKSLKHKSGSLRSWGPAVDDYRPLQKMVEMFGERGTVYNARTEGFFATRELMLEIFAYLMMCVPFDRDDVWRGNFPYEEFLLPTAVELLTQGRSLRRARHAVMTAPSERAFGLKSREPVDERHIPMLEGMGPDIFAFKFAPSFDSPVRSWVRSNLGYILPEGSPAYMMVEENDE